MIDKLLIDTDGRIALGPTGRLLIDDGNCPCCSPQAPPCSGSLAGNFPVDSLSQIAVVWNPDREPLYNGVEIIIDTFLSPPGVIPILASTVFHYEGDCSIAMPNQTTCTQGPASGGTATLSAACGALPDGPLSVVFTGIIWPTCAYRWGDGGFFPGSGCAQFVVSVGVSGPISLLYQGRLRNIRFYGRNPVPIPGLGHWEAHAWDGH